MNLLSIKLLLLMETMAKTTKKGFSNQLELFFTFQLISATVAACETSCQNRNSFVPLPPPSGPEPPVYWSVCFGGQFFSASVFKRHVLCVDWLVPGARPGEIASLSTIPTNPVPPLTCWGPAEHKTPPPWDDACIWRLIGGRVFALYPSPGSHLFSARAR